MHVKVSFAVKRLACNQIQNNTIPLENSIPIFIITTKSTSPEVDTIMKLGQFLYLEHISAEMEGTLLGHLHVEFLEDRPPGRLKKMTDNRRAFA